MSRNVFIISKNKKKIKKGRKKKKLYMVLASIEMRQGHFGNISCQFIPCRALEEKGLPS